MLAGDFEEAWRVNDRLREMGTEDPHRFWQGEGFTGKRVIVRCLHGFGDSIQFLRYLPQLQDLASKVYVEVAPKFVELARCLVGVDEVITWGPEAPQLPPEWDVQMEVMELPYVFRTRLTQLPLAQGYLRMDAPEKSPGAELQVGLSWTAGEWNPARGVPFNVLSPIFEVQGCDFWNLAPQLAPKASGIILHEDEQCRSTLIGLARRIAVADLVITVDTVAAHMAGAMGVPVWLLLQNEADWRWMSDREDSPWYPSICIFRQSKAGVWQSVIQQVTERLRQSVEVHSSHRRSAAQANEGELPSTESFVRVGC